MKYEIRNAKVSFAAIATILTGKIFDRVEFARFALFLAKESPSQVLADRETKWIPWILVQFPFLSAIDTSNITDENADKWLRKEGRKGPFVVRTVYLEVDKPH
ncbi:MAG: hypothetical protein WCQ60_01480 [bacterium]